MGAIGGRRIGRAAGKGRRVPAAGALAVLLAAGAASAEPPGAPPVSHFRYEAWWGGVYAAEFTLTMANDAGAFETAFRLETRGPLDWFVRLAVAAESRGRAESALAPDVYRSRFEGRRRHGATEIVYDPETRAAAVARRSGPRDGALAPDDEKPGDNPVPPAKRIGTVDPLTAFAEAVRRARTFAAGGGGRAAIPIFDGKRRFDLEVAYAGRTTRGVLGRRIETHRVRLATRLVAGTDQKTRLVWDRAAFDLYLDAERPWVPVQIVPEGPGPVINLVAECNAPCPLADGG